MGPTGPGPRATGSSSSMVAMTRTPTGPERAAHVLDPCRAGYLLYVRGGQSLLPITIVEGVTHQATLRVHVDRFFHSERTRSTWRSITSSMEGPTWMGPAAHGARKARAGAGNEEEREPGIWSGPAGAGGGLSAGYGRSAGPDLAVPLQVPPGHPVPPMNEESP